MIDLIDFVRESNRIEGIGREPTRAEINAHEILLTLDTITISHLETFVAIVAPGAELRDRAGMNVRVGAHTPLAGGPRIREELQWLLDRTNGFVDSPYQTHIAYESLHPFMDGNGRSGRVLWAWQMERVGEAPALSLPFLHRWYYQSLQGAR